MTSTLNLLAMRRVETALRITYTYVWSSSRKNMAAIIGMVNKILNIKGPFRSVRLPLMPGRTTISAALTAILTKKYTRRLHRRY